jgi:hypothetical protein
MGNARRSFCVRKLSDAQRILAKNGYSRLMHWMRIQDRVDPAHP